jgi:lipopolysaccharide biosynthesis glycosyltransferase
MKYAIVVCATHNWLAPAAVTLLSCAKHGAAKYADLLIVTPAPGPNQQDQLDLFNSKHGTTIRLIAADVGKLAEADAGRFSIGSLLRLRLAHHISSHYERVLYLDSDILACAPCKDIFDFDMGGRSLAAAEDIVLLQWVDKNATAHRKTIGMPQDIPYFQAGVLLLDWQNPECKEILITAYDKMLSGRNFPLADQDPLNLAAIGKWKRLPPKFNVDKRTDDFLGTRPIFRHFTGSIKPWTCWRVGFHRYRKFYRTSLVGTDWEAFAHQSQKSMRQSLSLKFIRRRLMFKTVRNLKKYLLL